MLTGCSLIIIINLDKSTEVFSILVMFSTVLTNIYLLWILYFATEMVWKTIGYWRPVSTANFFTIGFSSICFLVCIILVSARINELILIYTRVCEYFLN